MISNKSETKIVNIDNVEKNEQVYVARFILDDKLR